MKKLVLSNLFFLLSIGLFAQNTVATYPTLSANNGSGAVSYELVTTTGIDVLSFECVIYSGTLPVQIWYRPGGVVRPVDGPNGWILHETVTVTGNGSTVVNVPLTTPLPLAAGTYGMVIGNTSSTARYMTYNSGLPSTFTDGTVTLNTGVGVGFGGTLPGITIATRSFVGSVSYAPQSTAPNDAGTVRLDSPVNFCPGQQSVIATIKNFGINQINSVMVNWSIDGITQTPVNVATLLDTFGGIGVQETQVTLGSVTFTAGVTNDIAVWTTMPNNVTDTVTKNDSILVGVQPSLSGTFTIDATGSGDFLSFNDAVNDLNAYGVCGPVVFNVNSGVYNEQIRIGSVGGTSESNSITFQADPNNISPVEMTFNSSSADNYVVSLNGCEYVHFDGINLTATSSSYGVVTRFEGGAKYNVIKNGIMKSPLVTTTSTNNAVVYSSGADNGYNTIEGNHIYGGSSGIYYYGAGTTSLVEGVNIRDNHLEDMYYYGLYLYYTDGMKVYNNKIESKSSYTSGRGILSYYGDNGIHIVGNKILSHGTRWPLYGIYAPYQDGNDTARGLIANNWIHVGGPSESSTFYGQYTTSCNYLDVVYNSYVVEGTSTSSRAGYLYSGSSQKAYNNNFLNYGNGYAVYTLTGYYEDMDYNNLASNGTNLAYMSGAKTNLAAWQATGFGANSISENNIFANADSLRTCDTVLYKKGIALSAINFDIDGDLRNPTTPNIGSDAFIADAADFSIGDSVEFCGGSDLEIGASMNDATFLWSTGATTPTIVVTQEGNYTVTVNGPCASGIIDDIEVIDVNPVASFEIDEGNFIGGFSNTSEHGTSYHWDFGDGSSSDEVSPWHEYTENGPFTVTLTVMNDCDTVTISKDIQFSVGVNEAVFGDHVKVYPNPASGYFKLETGGIESQTVQLQMFNIKGQLELEQRMTLSSGSVETIDISRLNKGLYMIKLITNAEVLTKQLIVQ